jgi:hypothetical protein
MSRHNTRRALALALTTVLLSLSGSAIADGLVAKATDLSLAERTALQSQIDAHKLKHPAAFAAVRNVEGYKPEHYMKFRNPTPMVGRELRRLGRRALLPILEALAFDVWPRGAATTREWVALEIGMLEAVTALRDARSQAVLRAAFRNATDPSVSRAAAEGLGALCNAADPSSMQSSSASLAAASLAKLSKALVGRRRAAAIAGLGECRRHGSATRLIAELDATASASDAATIARALGTLGSSWAWSALGSQRKAEGSTIRAATADALVRAYVRIHDAAARAAIGDGLGMVAHSTTRALVRRHAGGADAATRRRLDALATRSERRARRKR